jgi:mannose-6-phosphate isomerase-like protein (cupin superfamily)
MSEHADIFITNIETETIHNDFYRKVLYTSQNQQIVVMSIKPKEDIEYEIHPDNDQFIRIEKGTGILLIGPKKESQYKLSDGVSVIIPKGTWHQVINTSDVDMLKLYTIYSPPHHPHDKVDVTRPKSDQCGGFKIYSKKTIMY